MMTAQMMEALDRLYEIAQNKFNVFMTYLTSGAIVADGAVKKVSPKAVEAGLTLSDWQIIVGMIYVISMIIPRLYAFYKWLMEQRKK